MDLFCCSSGPCTFLHRCPTRLVRHHLILVRIRVHLLLLVLVLMMMVILLLLPACRSFGMIPVLLGPPMTVLLKMIPSSAMATLWELLLAASVLPAVVAFASFLSTFVLAFAFVVLTLTIPPLVLSFSFSATASSSTAFSASLSWTPPGRGLLGVFQPTISLKVSLGSTMTTLILANSTYRFLSGRSLPR